MDDKLIPTLVLPGDEEEAQQAAAEAEAPVQEAAQPVQAAAAAVQTAPVEEAQQAPAQEEKKDEPLTPVDAQDDSLNFDNLSPEEQAAVLAFVERIDIHNSETVLKYGNAAQTKISQFSDKILEDVKTKDTGAISDMLTKLVAELKGFDVDEGKKGGLFGLFKKAGNNIVSFARSTTRSKRTLRRSSPRCRIIRNSSFPTARCSTSCMPRMSNTIMS